MRVAALKGETRKGVIDVAAYVWNLRHTRRSSHATA